jgi:hypothetical protein
MRPQHRGCTSKPCEDCSRIAFLYPLFSILYPFRTRTLNIWHSPLEALWSFVQFWWELSS